MNIFSNLYNQIVHGKQIKMPNVQEYIQTKITDVQSKAAVEVAQYQADLANISAGNPSVLSQDVEAVKVWFQALKNHIEGIL